MKFLSRQTIACRENVSIWTERQTVKTGNNILERLGNVTVCVHIVLDNLLQTGYVAHSKLVFHLR